MDHLDPNVLAALVEGRLRGDPLADAERHIDACATCRKELAALARRSRAAPASVATVRAIPQREPRESLERLGRYEVESLLGEGGMGTVYLALDVDLQRRVALKVLRGTRDDDVARSRLLREARAMARLHHPNVVMVHEVGRADDRDYVAMELVDGDTLAHWLAAAPRSRAEIIDAFLAAGRGLAAAHAAGLVHRDFKPHNVLCSRSGRVLVTDFGLARGVDAPRIDRMQQSLQGLATAATATPLGDLTVSGLALGTPAYMAPEQWAGGAVGPASDQFAFCVALWEALAGERPFRGRTDQELIAELRRGPASLDASKIPRRLRAALLRGLAPDPDERWPDMTTLLARLRRARRRPVLYVGGAALVLAAAAVPAYLVAHREPPPRANVELTCPPPARAPEAVWSDAARGELAGRSEIAALFEREVARWRALRPAACAAPERSPRLACFDRVLDRLELVERSMRSARGNIGADPIYDLVVDPLACMAASPPRIVVPSGDDIAAAFEVYGEVQTAEGDLDASTRERATTLSRSADPCAATLASLQLIDQRAEAAVTRAALATAAASAERCGDDHVIALAALQAAAFELWRPDVGAGAELARGHVEAAIAHIQQPDLFAAFHYITAQGALKRGAVERALVEVDRAIAGYAARDRGHSSLKAMALREKILFTRGRPADLAKIRSELQSARAAVVELHDASAIEWIDRLEAFTRLMQGDVEGAHVLWTALARRQLAHSQSQPVPREGDVVDATGHPVAGAIVYIGQALIADPLGPIPIEEPTLLAETTTDEHGRFAIDDVTGGGEAYAVHGAQRSPLMRVSPRMHFVLEPTRAVSGRIALAGVPATRCLAMAVEAKNPTFITVSPVAADGTFHLRNVSTEPIAVHVLVGMSDNVGRGAGQTRVPAGTVDISDVAVAIPPERDLYVIVRSTLSTALEAAHTTLYAGHLTNVQHVADRAKQLPVWSIAAFPPIVDELPPDVAAHFRAGDVVAHWGRVPEGDFDMCVTATPTRYATGVSSKFLIDHAAELEMRCAPVPARGDVIVLETPPQKRFD